MHQLLLVSGPSGVGKTSLMKEAGRHKIVTMTTRPKRTGEIEGIDYFFVTKETFERFIEEQEVIEYNIYPNGHYYGLTRTLLNKQLADGSAYIIVESEGMRKYKELYPDALSIFIYTDYESTKRQLLERGGDHEDIAQRLQHYEKEMTFASLYDLIIDNPYGQFEQTVQKIKDIDHTKKNAKW